jgi:hypothetical protein
MVLTGGSAGGVSPAFVSLDPGEKTAAQFGRRDGYALPSAARSASMQRQICISVQEASVARLERCFFTFLKSTDMVARFLPMG